MEQTYNQSAITYIKSDLTRYYGKSDLKTFFKAYLKNSTIRWHCAFRLCHDKGIHKYIGYALWSVNSSKKKYKYLRIRKSGSVYILDMADRLQSIQRHKLEITAICLSLLRLVQMRGGSNYRRQCLYRAKCLYC